MQRLFSVALVAAILTAPVGAEVATEDRAMAEAALADAVAEAEAAARQRWAFTMTYSELGGAAPRTTRVRFDPRLPQGERWVLVEPTVDALDKDQRKAFAKLRKSDDADKALVYGDLAATVAGLSLDGVEGDEARFVGAIGEGVGPKAMREATRLTLTVDIPHRFVSRIDVRSIAPFKPAAVARIDRLVAVQTYDRAGEIWPPLLVRSENEVSGKALLKTFDEKTRIVYDDFEPVVAEDFPETD